MHLFDFDILDEGNLVRHICGLPHVGKNKAVAVKDLLDSYAGNSEETSQIIAHTDSIFECESQFAEIVSKFLIW